MLFSSEITSCILLFWYDKLFAEESQFSILDLEVLSDMSSGLVWLPMKLENISVRSDKTEKSSKWKTVKWVSPYLWIFKMSTSAELQSQWKNLYKLYYFSAAKPMLLVLPGIVESIFSFSHCITSSDSLSNSEHTSFVRNIHRF